MSEQSMDSANATRLDLRLPPNLTRAHQQIIHRYLSGQESLGSDDWILLIEAMDALRRAEVIRGASSESFASIYDRMVDAVYSDAIIEQLLHLSHPESQCEPLRAVTSRRILADLRANGLWQAGVPASQFLVAFCLYWWQMFVRGYAFEIAIYQDLAESGIAYTAHDLRNRHARLSGHDIEIMGFRGDVKTSTYFMLTRRSESLALDFYITRMYHTSTRCWHRVVWLKPQFWRLLNGEPTPVACTAIWQVLPGVAQITLRGHDLIIVLYEEWKRRLIALQEGGKSCLRNGSVR